MKRCFALLLAGALALALLASCELMVPGPTERPPIGGATEPARSADPSQSQKTWKEGVGPDHDRSFSHGGGGLTTNAASTEDTFYYVVYRDKLIRYADKATGISGPLCGKPECTHDNADCNAYLSDTAWGLTNYDGRLYWVGTNGYRYIYSSALDGTDRRVVRELDREITGSSFSGSQVQFHRGYLYWAHYSNVVVNGVAQQVARVFAFSLDPDEEGFVIFEEENYGWMSVQPYLGGLYISTIDGDADRTDYDLVLYRWDIRTREMEELYRGVVPFIMEEIWVVDDGILLHGQYPTDSGFHRGVYKFSFESGEVDELFPMVDSVDGDRCSVADGLFVANTVNDSGEMKIVVKDFDGNTVLDTALKADWLTFDWPMDCYGVDETYMYFYCYSDYAVAVPLDGSEMKLLWSSDAGAY